MKDNHTYQCTTNYTFVNIFKLKQMIMRQL